MVKPTSNGATREGILRAALKRFAHSGYAAASVQQIVGDARVSKPTLYYYFPDKARLFEALVHEAHDERYRLMREAAGRSKNLRGQLVEILHVLFEYFASNRELMRISLATAFASPGEVPASLKYADRCQRNFEFVHSLIKRGLKNGELDRRFESRELAFGFYGQANAYLMTHLLMPASNLNRQTAERVVDLFLVGAAPKTKNKKTSRTQTVRDTKV
ncbi:MAG: TetR/AcrR family transcriptional regulator [Verrucomicrobia bacterium]|nr:MAG: TetR/AcrR family transcriptional regulator [Verrucomicrobiota bacterium]